MGNNVFEYPERKIEFFVKNGFKLPEKNSEYCNILK